MITALVALALYVCLAFCVIAILFLLGKIRETDIPYAIVIAICIGSVGAGLGLELKRRATQVEIVNSFIVVGR